MEMMKLDSDHEVILDLSGADCKPSNHPNREDVHLHHDPDSGLRSREKIAASTAVAEIPTTNITTTTSQSQPQVEEVTGQLKTTITEPAIPSNSQTDNIDKVSVTASPSEIAETLNAASPVTPGTPLMASPGEANNDDENNLPPTRKRVIKVRSVIEFSLFVCITLLLILSATMNKLKDKEIWSLKLWKFCGLGWPIFCGRLSSEWLVNIVAFLCVKNSVRAIHDEIFDIFLKIIRVTIWFTLTFLVWSFYNHPRSIDTTKVLNHIIDVIVSTVFVVWLWVVTTNAIKLFNSLFLNKRFSERIVENRFHQYILQTLSGPPVRELSEVHSSRSFSCSESNVIDVEKPQMIICRMVETASQTGFYTLPKTLDKSKYLMNPDEQNNRNITTEWEAKAAGDLIFRNVAKPGHKYIEKEDLLRFMEKKKDVDIVLRLIGGKDLKEESGRINEKFFLKRVVSMYMKSKFLGHSLNDIEEAMMKLLKFFNVLLVVVLIILWVILMGIAQTEVLLFIASQFLFVVFTFGNSAKSTFEAIIFVFLKHPFDVGDRCVIDGLQVVVEEVSILTTVFLNYDNEKIYYPNSTLATKSISNLSQSPEMRDTVEFDLDASTSVDNISALKAKIKTYIDSKPYLWRPKHSVRVREIADVNKMKMRLCVTHTLNFPDYEEKCDRISNLVLELRNIFQQLGIKNYQILPPTSSN